jgi:hypothetical protein
LTCFEKIQSKKTQSTLNFKKAVDVAQANSLWEAFLKFQNDSSFAIPEMQAVITKVLGNMAARNKKTQCCLTESKLGGEKEGWTFFFIACDHPSRNSTEAQILPHAVNCTILAHDFHDT